MNPLLATLQSWLGARTATVVHIGAGSGAVLDGYAGLPVARLVLAEGDPNVAAALVARSAPVAGVEVHAVVLGAAAGPVSWHRYNLRTFNGPLDAGGLVSLYPRLRPLGALALQSAAIGEWLLGLDLGADDVPRVLVLDVPGQDHALLGAVPDPLLWRFDAVLVRGCGDPPGPGWDSADALERLLPSRWFRPAATPAEQDPLWPIRLFVQDLAGRRRDAADRERQSMQAALAEAQAAQRALQDALETARRERDEQAHWHQENARWAHGLKAEKDALAAEVDTLRAALAEAQAAQHALQGELETARRERDEQAHWHQENAKWAHGLKAEKEALATDLDALRAEVDAQRRQVHALGAEREALAAQLREARDQGTAAVQALQDQLEAARRERDEQAHWHQENAKWAHGLKAEKEALAAELDEARAARQALADEMAERDARQRLLDAEILRAEAQLDLIKDVLIREKNF